MAQAGSNTMALAAEILEAINARDFGTIDRFTTEDVELLFPPGQVFTGRDGIERFFHLLDEVLPKLTLVGRRILAGDDFAVIEWDSSAETQIARDIDDMGVIVLQFKDGRVYRSRLYLDTMRWREILSDAGKG